MNEIYTVIGEILKKERKKRKIKAKSIAEALNILPANFSAYEAGKRHPDLVMLVRWCDALGCRLRFPMEKYDEIRHGGRKNMRKTNK